MTDDEIIKITKIYDAWKNARARVNSNVYYVGRIKMFPPWKDNFLSFYHYVIKHNLYKPKPYSLDRIDNDGDYAPGNIRWASHKVQNSNQRKPNKIYRPVVIIEQPIVVVEKPRILKFNSEASKLLLRYLDDEKLNEKEIKRLKELL